MIRTFAIAGGAMLTCLAGAQITSSGQSYLFRAKFTPGTKTLYKVEARGGPSEMIVSVMLPITEKVVKVAGGFATIQVSVASAKITQNGKPVKMGSGDNGQKEVVKLDSLNNNPGKESLGRQTHVEFPQQPIKIGASWTTVAFVPFAQGVQKVNATYTLEGFENLGGKRVARLGTYYLGRGGVTIKGKGKTWVSVADGSLVKGSMDMETSINGASVPIAVRISRS